MMRLKGAKKAIGHTIGPMFRFSRHNRANVQILTFITSL
jgi:hypothetical protein